jgi:hypothetical protein
MAKYLVLIYGDEQKWAAMPDQERQRLADGHAAFAAAAGSAVLGGHELQQPSKGTSLRRGRSDRPLVTDGPFVESKEGIGGFYLLEADDRDAAIELASRLPELAVDHSGVEIRPVLEAG